MQVSLNFNYFFKEKSHHSKRNAKAFLKLLNTVNKKSRVDLHNRDIHTYVYGSVHLHEKHWQRILKMEDISEACRQVNLLCFIASFQLIV